MKKNLLIVSHDAGGAEVVSAWVAYHPEHHYSFILEGPAVSVFSRRLGSIGYGKRDQLSDWVRHSDFVLTSTSGLADLEREAIQYAKKHVIKVAAYLDHWINYRERFIVAKSLVLPDEIWVGDLYAKEKAARLFPNQTICYQPNCYFREVSQKMKTVPSDASRVGNILFLTQPLDGLTSFFRDSCVAMKKWTDRDLFDQLIAGIRVWRETATVNIVRIRLHPQDSEERYQLWLQELSDVPIVLSRADDLLEDCKRSEVVIGAFSMAMVIALLAGCKVFSCLPEGVSDVLPYAIPSFENSWRQ